MVFDGKLWPPKGDPRTNSLSPFSRWTINSKNRSVHPFFESEIDGITRGNRFRYQNYGSYEEIPQMVKNQKIWGLTYGGVKVFHLMAVPWAGRSHTPKVDSRPPPPLPTVGARHPLLGFLRRPCFTLFGHWTTAIKYTPFPSIKKYHDKK